MRVDIFSFHSLYEKEKGKNLILCFDHMSDQRPGQQPLILLVEDDESIIKILWKKLEQESFHVLVAPDGDDGLNVCVKHHPDIILLDLVMPKMDGITMLKKLRQDPWGKNARVIILTNLSSPIKEQEAKKLGALKYIVKTDIGIESLMDLVKQTVRSAS